MVVRAAALLVLLATIPAPTRAGSALKRQIKVPGWPTLPFPFSEGVLHCTSCSEAQHGLNDACTLKISGNQGFDFMAKPPALVPGGISNQTKYAMKDIQSIVTAANATMDDVTSCTVWLRDIEDFEAMNDVYKTFFSVPYPTRAAAGGYALAGKGALVEIACEALAPCPYDA